MCVCVKKKQVSNISVHCNYIPKRNVFKPVSILRKSASTHFYCNKSSFIFSFSICHCFHDTKPSTVAAEFWLPGLEQSVLSTREVQDWGDRSSPYTAEASGKRHVASPTRAIGISSSVQQLRDWDHVLTSMQLKSKQPVPLLPLPQRKLKCFQKSSI